MNVISDIAGQYKALRALLRKMPDQEPLSVGDMIDRGPDSAEVVNFFREHGQALAGNHESMMVDAVLDGYVRYQPGVWEMNGGGATRESYQYWDPDALREDAQWMATLPLYWEDDDFFVSHTFPTHCRHPENLHADTWARANPDVWDKFQISGHNSHWGLRFWMDTEYDAAQGGANEVPRAYALSIDTSASKQICGVDLNTMRIYTQEYI